MINGEEEYKGVPYIIYPDRESPISGRFICPPGHPHYYAPLSEIIREIMKHGFLSQNSLWDSYDGCSMHTTIIRQRKE